MKYGLLTYRTTNLGDEIQSVAVKRLLPRIDVCLDREKLNKVKSEEKIKLIINGWFSLTNMEWPPSSDIEPLFVSFHISERSKKLIFTNLRFITYLKKYEPIGCRDQYTVNLLKENGIDAYFSGCLTLTLENNHSSRSEEILLVDLSKKVISLLPDQISSGTRLSHWSYIPQFKKVRILLETPARMIAKIIKNTILDTLTSRILTSLTIMDQSIKISEAERLLQKYSEASLVVTSRLHCALPCIAFGTPVIFVPPNPSDVRFEGYEDFLKIYSLYDLKHFNWNFIPQSIPPPALKENLIKRVNEFINK